MNGMSAKKKTGGKKPRQGGKQPDLTTTSIEGLDRVLNGGYSVGRPTVIRGASGSGKTLLALLFAAGQGDVKDPCVYASFDESPENLAAYLSTWQKPSAIEFVDMRLDPDMERVGDRLELGGMLVRIEHALKTSGAKRLVLDAFDMLFDAFEAHADVRGDLFRVFEWCRERGVTLVATCGLNPNYEPSTGLMDYASDCTVLLSQNLYDGMMTRTIRVLKCRGRAHGTNEYPFIIDADGISVMPVTETRMSSSASRKHMSVGIPELDLMLGGKGIWHGNAVMVSGRSGTGKSLLAAKIAETACNSGLKVLYFSFEEGRGQIVRDVASAGIKLAPHLKSGALVVHSHRPVEHGLEEHIIRIVNVIKAEEPSFVVLDPISALDELGSKTAFKNVVLRLCHLLKNKKVTVLMTELLPDDSNNYSSLNVSSIVDTWIRLRRDEIDGNFERFIYVHKARGQKTSSKIERFEITNNGLKIGV